MSILLEALRKSENRQRKGEIPTIHEYQPGPQDANGDSRARWIWWLLLPVAAIIAWLYWQQYGTRDEGGWDLVDHPQTEQSRPAAEPVTEVSRQSAPPVIGVAGRVIEEPVSTVDSSITSPVERPLAVNQPEARVAVAESVTKPATRDPSARETVPASKPLPKVTVPPRAEPEPRPEPVAASDSRERQPISYWELPASVRGQLPELKITVLVYAQNPADRFLLMGGKRLLEGDTVYGGLELEEVRRDGAVFRYQRYRFLLKQ